MSRRTGKPSRALPATPMKGLFARNAWVAGACLLAALVGGGVGFAVGKPDAVTDRIAELRRAEAERDVEQINELTVNARATARELSLLVSQFGAQPGPGAAEVPAATATQIGGWQEILRRAEERHSAQPSGSTATNVARGAFRNAVRALSAAVDTYAASQNATGAQRQTLLDLADRQRLTALSMWSVAATQLDQLNIDAGNGHQHVYLTNVTGEGVIPADGLPEGTR